MNPNDLPASTPCEVVLQHYNIPFQLKDRQVEAINKLSLCPRQGLYAEVGTGKTVMSTLIALYLRITGQRSHWFVIVPPVLILQWVRWLRVFPSISVMAYRGTPKVRQLLHPDADFSVMSLDIFKRDVERLEAFVGSLDAGAIIDEATAIKNTDTDNYRKVAMVFSGRGLMLLTGTPLTTPMDAYAYIRLLAPTIYRSKRHFENLHVEERDFFNNITKWGNLSLLAENFAVNSVRLLRKDVMTEIDEPLYDPVHYELTPRHARLYKQFAEEQVLLLEDGGKIDATSEQALYQKLQQLIMNPHILTGDASIVPAGYDVLEQVLATLGGRKLLVCCWYRNTVTAVRDWVRQTRSGWDGGDKVAEALLGGLTDREKERVIAAFKEDEDCKVLVLQPGAGGKGVDGLQYVAHDLLFLEIPPTAIDFQQVVGRLVRGGQTEVVHVRVAIATGTVQHRLWNNALRKEELANEVQGAERNLRELVYGG